MNKKVLVFSLLLATSSMLLDAKVHRCPKTPDLIGADLTDTDSDDTIDTDSDESEDELTPAEVFALQKKAFFDALLENAPLETITAKLDETPELARITFFYGIHHYQVTPFLYALLERNLELAEALLPYCDIDQATDTWGTPLHYLAQLRPTEFDDEFMENALDMVLDAQASVAVLNNNERTPLLEAVAANNIIAIKKLAAKKASAVEALFLAIELENTQAIAALIQYSNIHRFLLKENGCGESAFYLIQTKGLNAEVAEHLAMYQED